jgi:hypothetical protein
VVARHDAVALGADPVPMPPLPALTAARLTFGDDAPPAPHLFAALKPSAASVNGSPATLRWNGRPVNGCAVATTVALDELPRREPEHDVDAEPPADARPQHPDGSDPSTPPHQPGS